MGHYENDAKEKVHDSKCPHKEVREFSYKQVHLKALGKAAAAAAAANIPRSSRWQEIIKLRAEINQLDTKGTIQKKVWFFEKINKTEKPLVKLTKR
jgi:ribosomal protein L19E